MTEKRLMVVDDEEVIRMFMSDYFTHHGYKVCAAESAEEALAILEKETYPLFFLDLKLPRMNGIELCRHIRAKDPSAMIYALTGYANEHDIRACLDAGFIHCFFKPVEPSLLLRAADLATTALTKGGR